MNDADRMLLLLKKIRFIDEWDDSTENGSSDYRFIESEFGSYLINDLDEILYIPQVWLGADGFQQGGQDLPEVWQWNENDPEAEAVKFTVQDISKLKELIDVATGLRLMVPELQNEELIKEALWNLIKHGNIDRAAHIIGICKNLSINCPDIETLINDKDAIVKDLLISMKKNQLKQANLKIKDLRNLGKNWPELDLIQKSIDAALK